MDASFDVSFRHFEPTGRIRARIGELIGEFDKYEDDIVSGRIVIDGQNRHGNKTVVGIVVEVTYRGGVAVGRRSAEFPSPAGQHAFDTALTEAFHTAGSQIKQRVRRRQAPEQRRPPEDARHGRIERLNTDVRNGFIEVHGLGTLFFSEAVLEGSFDALRVGDEVLATLAEAESPYGPQASTVRPIGPLG